MQNISSPPGFDPRTVQPITITATLSQPIIGRGIAGKGLQLLRPVNSLARGPNLLTDGRERARFEPQSAESPQDAVPPAEVTSALEAICTQVKDFLHTRIPSVVADDVTWEIITQPNDKRFIYLCSESSHTKVVLRKFLAAILNPDVRNLDFPYTCSKIALFSSL